MASDARLVAPRRHLVERPLSEERVVADEGAVNGEEAQQQDDGGEHPSRTRRKDG